MNKIIFLQVTFCFFIIGTAKAQQFYYSNGQRITLTKDSNSMIIYNDDINRNRIVDSTRLEKVFDAQDDRLGQYSVIELKPNYQPTISDLSIKHSYGFTKPNGEKVYMSPFILIRLKQGLSITSIQDILDKYEIDLIYKEFGKLHIKCSNISDVLDLANEIHESEKAIWSQPDFLINTTRHQNWENQYYLNNTNHSYCGFDNDIDAFEAWNLTLSCNDITVAVIDDGVEDHPALEDDNGNSRVLAGFTPSGITNNGRPGAGDAHGQACAGIIAASHNSEIRGIAPNIYILPVKVRFGFIPASEYATAIEWAWQNGADVISNSWGGTNEDIIIDAINEAEELGRNGLGAIVTFSFRK